MKFLTLLALFGTLTRFGDEKVLVKAVATQPPVQTRFARKILESLIKIKRKSFLSCLSSKQMNELDKTSPRRWNRRRWWCSRWETFAACHWATSSSSGKPPAGSWGCWRCRDRRRGKGPAPEWRPRRGSRRKRDPEAEIICQAWTASQAVDFFISSLPPAFLQLVIYHFPVQTGSQW